MTERLPKGYQDKLADSIWRLAEVSMSRLIAVTPVPALVKGEVHQDDLCLEPELLITRAMPDALRVRPSKIGIDISEKELFELDDSLTMYSFKRLSLDMKKRSRVYETGIMFYSDDGSTIIPTLDRPAPGTPQRKGTAAWQALRNGHITKFSVDEADYFLETIESVTNKLCLDEIEGWNQ